MGWGETELYLEAVLRSQVGQGCGRGLWGTSWHSSPILHARLSLLL